MEYLEPSERSVLLDCWERNRKLRDFYSPVGCMFVVVLPEEDYGVAVFVRPLMREGVS